MLVALVGVGAVLYFGFLKGGSKEDDTANVNQTPASKSPARDHILGVTQGASQDAGSAPSPQGAGTQTPAPSGGQKLEDFLKSEYDRQNAECKKQHASAELAMGVTKVVRDTFAAVSLGCGEGGSTGYYARVNGQWQLAFKTDDTPSCSDVNKFSFSKEIVPECQTGGTESDNTNP